MEPVDKQRTFLSYPHCRETLALVEGKTYLIMGTSTDIHRDGESYVCFITVNRTMSTVCFLQQDIVCYSFRLKSSVLQRVGHRPNVSLFSPDISTFLVREPGSNIGPHKQSVRQGNTDLPV